MLPSSVQQKRDGTYQFREGTVGALRQALDQRIHLAVKRNPRVVNEDLINIIY